MNRHHLVIVSVLLLLVVGILVAENGPVAGERPQIHAAITDSSDLSRLRAIYQEFVDPQANSSCSVDMRVTTIYSTYAHDLDTSVATVHYAATPDRRHILSDSLSVFSDQSTLIAVIPQSKAIYVASIDQYDYKDVKRHMTALALESLFDEGKVEEAGIVRSPTGSLADMSYESNRKVVITPGYELQTRIGASRVTIVYNPVRKTIRNITVEFIEENRIRSTRIDYGEFRWGELPPSFELPVIRTIEDEKGNLLPIYRDYEVDDRWHPME